MKLNLILAGALASLISFGASGAQTRPMDVFKWEKRVIVMYADRSSDPWAFGQRVDLLEDRCAFDDRLPSRAGGVIVQVEAADRAASQKTQRRGLAAAAIHVEHVCQHTGIGMPGFGGDVGGFGHPAQIG